MKPLKLSLACAIIFTILLFPVVLLMVTGEITLFDLHGFGVDTEERVYLGTANGKILVWKDQQQIGTLHAPTSRGSAEDAIIVYQMSAGVFAAKIFLYVAALGWIVSFLSIWYFSIRQKKKHPSKGGTL